MLLLLHNLHCFGFLVRHDLFPLASHRLVQAQSRHGIGDTAMRAFLKVRGDLDLTRGTQIL